jgi:hypothetical protein
MFKHTLSRICAALMLITFSISSASAETNPQKNLCFDSHRVRQWLPINDETLFVDTGKHKYRIDFQSNCSNLNISSSLVFNGDPITGRVCNSPLNSVIAKGELCRIRNIQEIDRDTFNAATSRKRASISVKKN